MIEKYFEVITHLHQQGWAIYSFDWRGQGGSGRLLPDPHVGHIDDFRTWTKDLGFFWDHWQTETVGPHVVFGHSMGGHLVLRGAMEGQIAPDALILSAPMLGFETKIFPVSWAAAAISYLAKLFPERLAWPENERPSRKNVRRRSYLTHDDARYEDESWWRRQKPELLLGPPSLQWMSAAYRSVRWIASAKRPEKLKVPTLFIATDADKLVSPRAIRAFAARIPGARLLMFGDESAHEVLREVDAVRDKAVAAIDDFLNGLFPNR